MRETMNVLGIIAATITTGIVLTVGIISLISIIDCNAYENVTGRKSVSSFGTCYVEVAEGQMVPRSELEMRAITNEAE